MADEKKTEEQQIQQDQKPAGKPVLTRFLPWIIIAAVILFGAGAGFGLGRIFAPNRKAASAQAAQPAQSPETQLQPAKGGSADGEQTWYYDLEPVVANLNEPGVTRYARIALTLEIAASIDHKKGAAFLDQKRPLLKHWLMLHLANQTIEDTRGEKNLSRMQSQISDSFNEKLFPGSKPPIKRVLFKEFAIQ